MTSANVEWRCLLLCQFKGNTGFLSREIILVKLEKNTGKVHIWWLNAYVFFNASAMKRKVYVIGCRFTTV
jgi:hypothetical protein